MINKKRKIFISITSLFAISVIGTMSVFTSLFNSVKGDSNSDYTISFEAKDRSTQGDSSISVSPSPDTGAKITFTQSWNGTSSINENYWRYLDGMNNAVEFTFISSSVTKDNKTYDEGINFKNISFEAWAAYETLSSSNYISLSCKKNLNDDWVEVKKITSGMNINESYDFGTTGYKYFKLFAKVPYIPNLTKCIGFKKLTITYSCGL